MRKMGLGAIMAFLCGLCAIIALAGASAWHGLGDIALLGDFRAMAVSAATVLLVYVYAILVHRTIATIAPLREGPIGAGSRQEFCYQVYILAYLALFNTLIRSRVIPIPLMRLVYLALGARLGPNTYSAGTIFDPLFVSIGANCLVGEAALLVPHVLEGNILAHYRISIGNNVTIGAHAVVLAGVTIADDAIVAAGSMVAKGTRINTGETWGGSPARRLTVGSASALEARQVVNG